MPNDVNITLSGDSGDAQQAWLQMIGIMQQMEKQLGRMGSRLEKGQKKTADNMEKANSAAKRFVNSLKSFGTAYYALNTVRNGIRLINQEIEAGIALGQKQKDPLIAQRTAMYQLMTMAPQNFEKIKPIIEKYQGPIDRAELVKGVIQTISTSPLPQVQAAQAAVQTAQTFPFLARTPEDLAMTATAAANIAGMAPRFMKKRPGGGIDISQGLNFMQQFLTVSSQGQVEPFAKFVVPAAKQLVENFGYSPQEAATFLSVAGTKGVDISGRMSSRVVLTIAEQLKELSARYTGKSLSGADALKWIRGGSESAVAARNELFGVNNPLAKAFAEAASVEGMSATEAKGHLAGAQRYKTIMTNILTGQPESMELWNRFYGQMSPENIQAAAERRKRLRGAAYFAPLRAEWGAQAAGGEMAEKQTPEAGFALFMSQLNALQEAAGYGEGSPTRWFKRLGYKMSSYERFRTEAQRKELLRTEMLTLLLGQMDQASLQRLSGHVGKMNVEELLRVYQESPEVYTERQRNILRAYQTTIEGGGEQAPIQVHVVGDDVRANQPVGAAAPVPAEQDLSE